MSTLEGTFIQWGIYLICRDNSLKYCRRNINMGLEYFRPGFVIYIFFFNSLWCGDFWNTAEITLNWITATLVAQNCREYSCAVKIYTCIADHESYNLSLSCPFSSYVVISYFIILIPYKYMHLICTFT